MKKFYLLLLIFISVYSIDVAAQEKNLIKNFGGTLNFGIGVGGYAGYYSYTSQNIPVISFNYEFNVARNFTLAPFISISMRKESYYWGNNNYPKKYYYYRETIIPIGIKGSYYLNQLLKSNGNWDFYIGGSLGFAIISSRWDDDYYGDKDYYKQGNSLFLDLHIGTEYHLNSRIGLFLDLSTGVSTIGIALH